MGKNQKKKFFRFFGIRMTQFVKKIKKKIFEFFDPKKFYHPRWGDPQWAKIKKKLFFDFWHQNDSIREKKQKKIFDPKFGPGMCGMWAQKGSRWVFG